MKKIALTSLVKRQVTEELECWGIRSFIRSNLYSLSSSLSINILTWNDREKGVTGKDGLAFISLIQYPLLDPSVKAR